METTVVDPNSIEKRTYRDVRGVVTGIREVNNGGAEIIWTSYAHDPLKQLVEITDDQDNVSRITYDNFGRTIGVESPDTGLTESHYDLAGNRIAKVTANLRDAGEQISYDYDFKRLISIAYPEFSQNDVAYAYGAPGAPFNRAGRIVLVTDESGSEERFYGKLGEIVKEIKTVASDTQGNSQNSPEIYTTEYTYDTWSRLQQLLYPDGEVLTYQYDSGGLVRAATGVKNGVSFPYLQRREYDKFSELAFVQTQNQVRTTLAYDPLDRRLNLLTAGKIGAALFQNLHYTYDDVGNVLQTHNQVAVPAPNQFGGPVLQTYTYDDLYRLVSATGSHQYGPNKSDVYSLDITYDTIHNITSKDQTNDLIKPSGQAVPQQKTTYAYSYSYGGPQVHAPTHIGERSFFYDANGNQIGWEHDQNGTARTVVWDEENRIQSVFDNGHEKTYKYDDSGERVIKRGPQGETAYVNPYFSVRNRTVATKHVYADTTRVSSKLSPGFTNPQPPNGVPESNFLYFYHPDHLGSSSYITAGNGQLFEHLQYFPSGETWVQEKSNTQNAPYLFTAKELDEETELYYYGARYYDPRVSVFSPADPLFMESPARGLRDPQFYSLYTYANNNPLKFIDPDGRDVIIIVGGDTKHASQLAQFKQHAKTLTAALKAENVKVTEIRGFGDLAKAGKDIRSKGGQVQAIVFIGHGNPGAFAPDYDYTDSQLLKVDQAAAKAGLVKGGALIALSCFTGGLGPTAKDDLKEKGWSLYGTDQYYGWAGSGKDLKVGVVPTTAYGTSKQADFLKQPGQEMLSERTGQGSRTNVLKAIVNAERGKKDSEEE
jgi:RHS repeat-associated protein